MATDMRMATDKSTPAALPGRGTGLAAALRPLAIDVGIPLGSYYLLHGAFGLSIWLSLALSSIGPAARAAGSLAARRRLNLLAALMLAVNLAGIAVSFLTGDPRAMIAKDAAVTVVLYNKRNVKVNHAFKKGEMKPADVDKIVGELSKILPEKKK